MDFLLTFHFIFVVLRDSIDFFNFFFVLYKFIECLLSCFKLSGDLVSFLPWAQIVPPLCFHCMNPKLD